MKINNQIPFTGGKWIVGKPSNKVIQSVTENIYASRIGPFREAIQNAKDFFTSSELIGSDKIAVLNFVKDDLTHARLDLYKVIDGKVEKIASNSLAPRVEGHLDGKGIFYNWLRLLAESGILK